VRFALAEKALSWDSRHVDLFLFENWAPDYAALNPKGVVPTMVHNGHVVTESNVILEYIEDCFSETALRPDAAHDRAVMRRWLLAIDEVVHPSVVEVSFNLRHRPRLVKYPQAELEAIAAGHPDPDLREDWLRRVREGVPAASEERCYRRLDRFAARLEDQLRRSSWLAGDRFSLADIAVAPYANRIEVLAHPEALDPARRPHLAEWWRRVQDRAGYQEAFSFQNPDPDDPIKR
jgi:glutathione S-transferase